MGEGLSTSGAAAVCIGAHGLGAWEREEFAVALDRAANEPGYRVIPVLLPGLPDPVDPSILPPFLALRTWVDLRGGVTSPDAFQRLVNAIKGLPPPLPPAEAADVTCPYLGLRTFEEKDAKVFFGREAEVQRLLEKLKARRALAVLGASGTGKSSLVRAGLVPALRDGALPGSDAWNIRFVIPGRRPIDELAAQLSTVVGDRDVPAIADRLMADRRTLALGLAAALPERVTVVWVVDQLEELFTVAEATQVEPFVANLEYASARSARSTAVLTLRADFYPRCIEHPQLATLISSNPFLVAPMTRGDLRVAIEQPARLEGVELEEGLADAILDDVERSPGALPLLEHAMVELWARRRGSLLTLEGYRAAGGVGGALAQRAEEAYAALDGSEQAVARRLLLRLTEPGHGTEDTRRRAPMHELETESDEPDVVEAVARTLVDARLLTTSGDGGERWIEVSHEALIRGWPRLREWLDEDRDSLVLHRRLTNGADEWERRGHDSGVLQRGGQLEETLLWRKREGPILNPHERAFLAASIRMRRRGTLARAAAAVGTVAVVAGLVVLAKPEVEAYFLRQEALDRSPMAAVGGGVALLGGTGDRPRQRVRLAAFSIDRYEVTNAQYRRCVEAGHCSGPQAPSGAPTYLEAGDELPVVNVTAQQAAAFCEWLGRRLPSDAEWERAARGPRGAPWPWGRERPTSRIANLLFEDPRPALAAIDDPRFADGVSRDGVTHMAGNAMEWTRTPASCNSYRCDAMWDGRARINSLWSRGRSWSVPPGPISGVDALPTDPNLENDDLGFRCARSSE